MANDHKAPKCTTRIYAKKYREGKTEVELLEEANRNMAAMIRLSVAASTAKEYLRMVGDYVDYARRIGIEDSGLFPARPLLINLWVASHRGFIKSKSMQNKLAALRWYHETNELTWLATKKTFILCKSLDADAPASSWKPRRKPITLEMIYELERTLPKTNKGTAIMAIAAISFFGQLRLGEPLPKTATTANETIHPTWSNVEWDEKKGIISLFLPWTKTKKKGGEMVFIASQNGSIDPYGALRRHWERNGRYLGQEAHLYEYWDEKGRRRGLDKVEFLKGCNEVWKAAGYENYSGHSFRIGGTTMFLTMGVDTKVVQSLGRWSSDSYMLYWAKKDAICDQNTKNKAVLG